MSNEAYINDVLRSLTMVRFVGAMAVDGSRFRAAVTWPSVTAFDSTALRTARAVSSNRDD